MKHTIASFVIKVNASTDSKKLSDGSIQKYEYGMVSIRTPELKEYIGKRVKIKILKVDGKSGVG
jgi:hexokinase